jgi:hypothetical protein
MILLFFYISKKSKGGKKIIREQAMSLNFDFNSLLKFSYSWDVHIL